MHEHDESDLILVYYLIEFRDLVYCILLQDLHHNLLTGIRQCVSLQ